VTIQPRPKRSHTDELIARSGHLVHKLKAKDSTGRWAFYFVLVSPAKERLFLKAVNGKGTIDLEKYGKVIASCYGEHITEATKVYLKEKYGFDV
jgi:hypothetical protein